VSVQVWPVRQPALLLHALRQVLSTGRHASPAAQAPPAPHAASPDSWQKATPLTVTQRPATAHSVDAVHAWWQLPNLHKNELAQSLVVVHAAPTPAPTAPSVPASSGLSTQNESVQIWLLRQPALLVHALRQVLSAVLQTIGETHFGPQTDSAWV
jgi:hypothetical protein